LPGGERDGGSLEALRAEHPWLPSALARRWARSYGTRARRVVGEARRIEELGRDFGAGLHERELAYLRDVEWVSCTDDVIWRRTKLGLRLAPVQVAEIDRWFTRAIAPAGTGHGARAAQ
jgi:glycerol-3-phosphate dehydrogenase